MPDPWAFGWNQLLTIAGLIITVVIAIGGFKTFGRWKREKIEEMRIDVAIRALALSYKSKFVFENIRSEMSFGYEWKDMPERPGDTEEKRGERGPFYAILKRIEAHKAFFENAWELQVECTAIFFYATVRNQLAHSTQPPPVRSAQAAGRNALGVPRACA